MRKRLPFKDKYQKKEQEEPEFQILITQWVAYAMHLDPRHYCYWHKGWMTVSVALVGLLCRLPRPSVRPVLPRSANTEGGSTVFGSLMAGISLARLLNPCIFNIDVKSRLLRGWLRYRLVSLTPFPRHPCQLKHGRLASSGNSGRRVLRVRQLET
ncbi:hypothetical protein BDV11DRAFT_21441 [Aspergillus similis]